jgi:VWFA-related protein
MKVFECRNSIFRLIFIAINRGLVDIYSKSPQLNGDPKNTPPNFFHTLSEKMFVRRHLPLIVCSALLTMLAFIEPTTLAQTPTPAQTQSKPPDDVVKVFTELVQTDVMVFDKQGRFVNGLTKDNFEIKVDGQARPIQFFEQINAGTKDEEAQLAAARGNPIPGGLTATRVVPLDRGRTILFFVDDFHLDPSGFSSSRKIISDFIEKDLAQNDQAAIASATGQIGFLQQLTNEKTVLRLALDRLGTRTYTVTDIERPTMGEYEAMLIDNNNIDVFEFFVNETIRINGGRQFGREMAESMVRNRAQSILAQAAMFNTNMLTALERLVRNAKDIPGRKLVFFISNGFLVHNRRGDAISRLQRITSFAAKAGVVIYSLDARGLTAAQGDLTGDRPMDLDGTLARSTQGENFAVQDGLNALARDTGGRPIFNTNDFRPGLGGALKETAVYYLLAWQPELSKQKAGRFRNLQVNVVGRSDLVVRVRKGFFDTDPSAPVAEAKKPATPVDENKVSASKLREAIAAPYPKTGVPLSLAINYYDTATKGPTLATSVQIPGEFMLFGPRDGKTQAVVDVTGVYFDDKGQAKADFYERLVTTAASPEEAKTYRGDITYTYPANLAPGLYQVRVAVRDDKSGRMGTAHSWFEIPDLSKKRLCMSSLLLGERTQAMMRNVSNSGDVGSVMLNPSHRFRSDSTMRFVVFAYNAALSETGQKADIAVQVLVIRDDQPVITTALRQIVTDGMNDLARIPYAAEVPLSGLQTGRYVLQVTLIDRTSKASMTRQTNFEVY